VSDETNYWFPAKRYGWGWGYPATWQGWVVIAGYVGLIGAGATIIAPSMHPGLFLAYLVFLTLVLIVICWVKGEPPHWRWGKRNGA